MKPKTFADGEKAVLEALETHFPDPLTAADAYIRAINGTPIKDQHMLVAIILQRHYITTAKRRVTTQKVIPPEHYAEVARPIHERVNEWITEALSANQPVSTTARTLWNKLSAYEGDDRTLAFSFLLCPSHSLVPYAYLATAPTLLPPDLYAKAYDGALDKVAEMFRLLRASCSLEEKAVRLDNLLDRCEPTEKIALLRVLTEWAIRGGTREVVLVGVTIEGLPDGSPDETEEEPA